jgi:hypothetical protein
VRKTNRPELGRARSRPRVHEARPERFHAALTGAAMRVGLEEMARRLAIRPVCGGWLADQ